MKEKRRLSETIVFSAFFVFILTVSLLSPYVSDDYYYQYLMGEMRSAGEVFSFFLHFGNGCILGNLLAFVLSNNLAVCAIVKASVATAILFSGHLLVEKITGKGSAVLSVFFALLFPPVITAEVITWTSGFSNYLPPILILLIIANILLRDGDRLRFPASVAVFFLGIAGQLFVEHSSVIDLVLIGGLSGYLVFREKKNIAESVSALAGTAIGTAVIFLIPLMTDAAGKLSGYRKIYLDLWDGESQFYVISSVMQIIRELCGGWLFWLLFASLLFALLVKTTGRRKVAALIISAPALFAYPALSLILTVRPDLKRQYLLSTLAFAFFFIATAVILIRYAVLSGRTGITCTVLFACACVSVAPLVVVYPIGPRCYALAVTFMIVLSCVIAVELLHPLSKRQIICFCIASALIVSAVIGAYIKLNADYRERDLYIRDKIENTTGRVEFKKINSPFLHYYADSMIDYRYYTDTPGDRPLIAVDYDGKTVPDRQPEPIPY
ncbi:MAG: hypothetical protein J6V48_01360 [Clostridia bacterium]|nr:hypothetical protein [Clostridia bacterium]